MNTFSLKKDKYLWEYFHKLYARMGGIFNSIKKCESVKLGCFIRTGTS